MCVCATYVCVCGVATPARGAFYIVYRIYCSFCINESSQNEQGCYVHADVFIASNVLLSILNYENIYTVHQMCNVRILFIEWDVVLLRMIRDCILLCVVEWLSARYTYHLPKSTLLSSRIPRLVERFVRWRRLPLGSHQLKHESTPIT